MARSPYNSLNIVTPPEMYRDLHLIAKEQDRSVSSVVRSIVAPVLAKRRQRIAAAKEPARASPEAA
jgi:hypothetical protein